MNPNNILSHAKQAAKSEQEINRANMAELRKKVREKIMKYRDNEVAC